MRRRALDACFNMYGYLNLVRSNPQSILPFFESRNMNKFLLVALVVFAPSVALAGGGSSKGNTGTIKVTNDAPTASPIAWLLSIQAIH